MEMKKTVEPRVESMGNWRRNVAERYRISAEMKDIVAPRVESMEDRGGMWWSGRETAAERKKTAAPRVSSSIEKKKSRQKKENTLEVESNSYTKAT